MFAARGRFVKEVAFRSRPPASRRDERYVTSRRALRRLTGTSQRADWRAWYAHLAKPPFLRLNRADIPDFRNKAPVRRAKDAMARNLQ